VVVYVDGVGVVERGRGGKKYFMILLITYVGYYQQCIFMYPEDMQ